MAPRLPIPTPAQVLYYGQGYFAKGLGKPVTITAGERDFMVQMMITLTFFVLYTVFFTSSGFQYGVSAPFDALGFSAQAYPQVFNFLVSYGLVFVVLLFGLMPIVVNVAPRLLVRLALRVVPFPTQARRTTCRTHKCTLPTTDSPPARTTRTRHHASLTRTHPYA
jgi:hypothetical protein